MLVGAVHDVSKTDKEQRRKGVERMALLVKQRLADSEIKYFLEKPHTVGAVLTRLRPTLDTPTPV